MLATIFFAALQVTEVLPIDERMAAYEAALPRLREIQMQTEEEIGRLGPREPGWATSGLSAASAIAARRGSATRHVLGEWEVGSHGVVTAADQPLGVPRALRRYTVRAYEGPVDYHAYNRLSPGVVIHSFGALLRIGNAECQRSQGIELISREAWRHWSPETALIAFGVARASRDDPRTYCMIFRPVDNGRFLQVAYSTEGRPYVTVNEDGQTFVVTSHADAAARIFGAESAPPTTD